MYRISRYRIFLPETGGKEPKNVHIVFQYARIVSKSVILVGMLRVFGDLQPRFAG